MTARDYGLNAIKINGQKRNWLKLCARVSEEQSEWELEVQGARGKS